MSKPQQQSSNYGNRYHDGGYYDRQGNWIDRPRRRHPREYYPPPRQYVPEPVVYLNPYDNKAPLTQTPTASSAAGKQGFSKPLGAMQQEDEEDFYGDDYYYDDGYSFEDDEAYAQQEQAAQQQQQSVEEQNPHLSALAAKHAPYQAMTDDELLQDAKLKYDTIVHEADRSISPGQLLDKNMTMKNNGEIVFSIANGHLVPVSGTCKKDIPLSRENRSDLKNDLVESITVSMTSNFPKKLLVSFPNIASIGDEFFRGDAKHVVHTIPAGALSENKPYEFTFKRTITNGIAAFAATYDSPSPDSMNSSICDTGRGYCLVPFTHSIIHYYNKDHQNDGLAITEDKLNATLGGDVKMDKKDVDKYIEIAKNGINEKISLGNVTSDMKVVLSVPAPTSHTVMSSRLNAANTNKELSGKLQAPTFLGFADVNYILGKDAGEGARERFMKTPFKFDMTIKVNYLKLDGRAIEHVK